MTRRLGTGRGHKAVDAAGNVGAGCRSDSGTYATVAAGLSLRDPR